MPRHSPYALVRFNFSFRYLSITSVCSLNCLSFFFKQIRVCISTQLFSSLWKDFYLLFLAYISTIRFNCNIFLPFRKNLFLFSKNSPLICSFLLKIYFIPLSMIILRHTKCVWWAQVDSNHRPRAYQARALTTWAMSPFRDFLGFAHLFPLVEIMGFEPMTPCLQGRCSPSWAIPPFIRVTDHQKLNNKF